MAWPQENQMVYNVPLKVRINPNFRGKPINSGVQENGVRPVGIHFNPHWKPKTEDFVNDRITASDIGNTPSSYPASSLRRTIHINRKVISNGMSQSISMLIKQEQLSYNTVAASIAPYEDLVEHKPTESQSPSKTKSSLAPSSNQKKYEVNSLMKVKRMTDSPAQLNKFRKNLDSAKSLAMRSAKVVRSKYKYLNSSVTPHLVPPHLLKLQNTQSKMSTSTSRFKYVKQTEGLNVVGKSSLSPKNHIVSRFKLVKGATTSRNEMKPTILTPRRVKVQKILESVKNIPEHTMKSRYKLSKEIETIPKQINGFKNRSFTPKSKTNSRYKFVRTAQIQRTPLKRKSPRALKSRFKIVRGTGTQPTKSTRYRLVRNVQGMPSYKHKMYPPTSPFGRKNKWVNSRVDLQATKVITSNRKLLRIGRRPENKSDKIRKAKLLNIGGVFYRSTRTTLTRSCGVATPSSSGETTPHPVKGQVLSIRGSKFLLDKTGKTLQRLTPNKSPISRIHIGGVTFVPSTENTLVRSLVHEARYLVSQAKQKSIAVLTSKLRKNNQPCLIYQRLGKCRLHDKERCPKVHDPKKIAICKDFVNGKCLKSAAECQLSHDVGPEKMPTCHFFLEGCCVRDPCPYSHVKLNQKAAICRDFLSGYCSAGDKCKKRHVFLCPEFEETKSCSKGKYCTYRHAGEVRTRPPHGCSDVIATKKAAPSEGSKDIHLADTLTRYYLKNDGSAQADKNDGGCHSGSESEPVLLLPERSKLGNLPGFIPL